MGGTSGRYQVHPSTTPAKTNMEPQNGGLEDDFSFQRGDFQVLC